MVPSVPASAPPWQLAWAWGPLWLARASNLQQQAPGYLHSFGTPQTQNPHWGPVTLACQRSARMAQGSFGRSTPSRRSQCSNQGSSGVCCSNCRKLCHTEHCWKWAKTIAGCSAHTGDPLGSCSGWCVVSCQPDGTSGPGSWGRWAGSRRGGRSPGSRCRPPLAAHASPATAASTPQHHCHSRWDGHICEIRDAHDG